MWNHHDCIKMLKLSINTHFYNYIQELWGHCVYKYIEIDFIFFRVDLFFVPVFQFFRFFKTALTLLWSIFGMGSADSIKLGVNHPAPQFMGFLLFTTFHVLIVVMLINMLIAMMTTSFESIQVS